MKIKTFAPGGTDFVNIGKANFLFQAPGDYVFRLNSATEHMSAWERSPRWAAQRA
jgi:hypothetical protein